MCRSATILKSALLVFPVVRSRCCCSKVQQVQLSSLAFKPFLPHITHHGLYVYHLVSPELLCGAVADIDVNLLAAPIAVLFPARTRSLPSW